MMDRVMSVDPGHLYHTLGHMWKWSDDFADPSDQTITRVSLEMMRELNTSAPMAHALVMRAIALVSYCKDLNRLADLYCLETVLPLCQAAASLSPDHVRIEAAGPRLDHAAMKAALWVL